MFFRRQRGRRNANRSLSAKEDEPSFLEGRSNSSTTGQSRSTGTHLSDCEASSASTRRNGGDREGPPTIGEDQTSVSDGERQLHFMKHLFEVSQKLLDETPDERKTSLKDPSEQLSSYPPVSYIEPEIIQQSQKKMPNDQSVVTKKQPKLRFGDSLIRCVALCSVPSMTNEEESELLVPPSNTEPSRIPESISFRRRTSSTISQINKQESEDSLERNFNILAAELEVEEVEGNGKSLALPAFDAIPTKARSFGASTIPTRQSLLL